MKKKIFLVAILFLLFTVIGAKDAFAVTVYNETDFRNALAQGQGVITIGNSINFYSPLSIGYNVTINAGTNDNALRCINPTSSFITITNGATVTIAGVVIDLRGNVAYAGMNGIRVPSGNTLIYDGSLIDGGLGNTGLLIESGGKVTVRRGDFVYSNKGIRMLGNATLNYSVTGDMSFWNNNIGLSYEGSSTCNLSNSRMIIRNNTTGIQVSSGTVKMSTGNVYSNTYGVIVAGGTFEQSGGSIYSNSHGVNVRSATFNKTGGGISSNTHGVVLTSGYTGKMNMTGGSISGNSSYAVYHEQEGDDRCIIRGGTVSGYIYLAKSNNYVTTNDKKVALSVRPSSYYLDRRLVKTDSNAYANNEIGSVTMYPNGSWYKYVNGQYIVVWTGANVVVQCVDDVTNEVIHTEIKNGTIGDSVTLTDPTVAGYELVSRPTETTYTYTQADQTVVYRYRKVSNLIVKHIDENSNAVLQTETIPLKQGDEYTTSVRSIPGYSNTSIPTNVTITMERADVELVYGYKKITEGVDVKYIDQVTGEEILSEHLDGLEKDPYTTEAKTIDGYILVKSPANVTGEMTVEKITVTYEYRLLSDVIVKYLDENYGTSITDDIVTTYKEGDPYTSEEKSFGGYQLTNKTDNLSGTVVRSDITVIYYYKRISGGVETRFIDQVTGDEIEAPVSQTGLDKDAYTTSPKTISGYTLVKTPDNATGQMAVEKTTVTYEYRKNSDVVVKYVDENYNIELAKVTTTYKEGDVYTTEEKTFTGYQLTGKTDNATGTMGRNEIEVVYKYKKISEGVDVKYIDQVTGAELVSEHIAGLEKDPYTTEPKVIDGYQLVSLPDNGEGEMIVGKTTVIYEYRKNSDVIVKYIDENYGTEIREEIVSTYKEGDPYTTTQIEFNGYQLTNKTNNTAGTVAREDIIVIYNYKKISGGVETRFIDQVTRQEISDSVMQAGLEKDDYTTTAKTINDYELVLTPSNSTGEMVVDRTTVTYEYRNISYVTAKYIDENTGRTIINDVVVKYLEQDRYTTEQKSFGGYQLTGKTNNTSGTIARSDIVVEYRYKKTANGVETKFIDQVTKEEIATSEFQAGLENDIYTTLPKEIAGYELVKTPTNANGNMTVDRITVTYEYRLLSTVTTKYIDVNNGNAIMNPVVEHYKEGDIYTTDEKVLVGYELVSKTNNTIGTMGRQNIEVTYSYKQLSGGVEIIYVDQINGNPLTASVVKTGLENEPYTSEAKVIDGYTLVKTPTNASGKMGIDKILVRYEYRKLSNVVSKYIDINSNTKIVEDVIQTLKEGDRYTTEQKSLSGYQLINNPKDKNGIIERENIEIVYEYKKVSTGVDVKYIDQVTKQEIADTIHIDGVEKDNYTTEAKVIKGYELVLIPTNKNGEMTAEKITVTYEYRLLSEVTTRHIDANTGKEIVEADVAMYKEGDQYTTSAKDLEGYVVTKNPTNPTGTMGREDIEVVYEYKLVSNGLVVKYIDEATNELLDIEEFYGNENDVIKLEEKTFEKYTLTKRPTATEIVLTVEPQEVRFYYKKLIDITIKGIDTNTREVLYTQVQSGIEGEEYTTAPQDVPGYQLVVTPSNASGVYSKDSAEIIYEYRRGAYGVLVRHIDKEDNTILDEKLITGYIGEEYRTEKNTYEGYEFVEVVGNPVGKLTEEKIEVTYYYTKTVGIVEVVYVDTEGNELLKESITGKLGSEYEIIPKQITNCKLKETVGNTKGTFTEEKQIVKFVMEKIKGKVIVNLYDETGKLLGTINGTDYVGEIFEVDLPEKEGYYIDGDTTIRVEYAEGEIVINVVYKEIKPEVGEVEIIYVDTEGRELLKETITGEVGTTYEIPAKQMENYKVKETIGNTKGTYTEEKQVVKFVMEKIKGKVIVNIVDEDGNLLDQIIKEGNVGEDYIVELPGKDGYYVEGDTTLTGKYEEGEKVITVVYKEIKPEIGTVEVIYVDTEGNELLKESITGDLGSEYEVKIKQITNYKVKETIGNTKGTFTKDKQVVKFVMEKIKGKVIVNLFDEEGNLLDQIVKEGYVGDDFRVDLPGKEGYYVQGDTTFTGVYKEGEIVINVVYVKAPVEPVEPEIPQQPEEEEKIEPPATGDINVAIYIMGALASIVLLTKTLLKNSKN